MHTPPKFLMWLLDRCCPESRPDLKGDLLELYDYWLNEHGKSVANQKLLRDIVNIVPLKFIIKEKKHKSVAMFNTNIKIARRMLLKNKLYTAINICGLSVSLAVCMIILLFIRDEFSFDKHFQNADTIYRVAGVYSQGGADRVSSAQTSYLVKPILEHDIAGIESITRADFTFDMVTIDGDKQYQQPNMVFADSIFFDVFKLSFLKGNAATALDRPENVVLDQHTAITYFGTDDVLGKLVDLRGKQFVITGVIKDLPANSHFRCSMVFPISGVKQWYPDWVLTNASGTSLYTYIRTEHNFNTGDFESAARKQVAQHWKWEGSSAPAYFLQPLTSIHLESNLQSEVLVNGSLSTVYIFATAAIVIFILAFINYINLTTASSFQRGKEVGMKKVLGSTVRMQMSQFQTESFMVASLSVVLAGAFAFFAMPAFNELSGKTLVFNPFNDRVLGLGILCLMLVLALVAGAFPAMVLLRSSTMKMLQDRIELRAGKSWVRNGLIVFQFSISITLIVCTLIVLHQISFIRNADLGIDPESVILIPLPNKEAADKFDLLKTEMLRHAAITGVSASSGKVTERVGGWRQYKTDAAQQEEINCPGAAVSHDFFETMKASLTQGRTFSKEHPADVATGYIVNESAVEFLGLQDPLGKPLIGSAFNGSQWSRRNGEIIGVVKDFHTASLHDKVQPLIFYLASDKTEWFGWMEVRIRTENMQEAVGSLKTTWKNVIGDRPFEFEYMDEAIAAHYQSEDRFLKIFTTFSMLAIMLGGLGLFGLTAFMAKRRTKEIGVRRVMGASTYELIGILSADFIRLVLVANIVAWPVAYYCMRKWMTNFAYKTSIPLWTFFATGAAVLAIAFLCILFHSLKVTRISPVRSLKNE